MGTIAAALFDVDGVLLDTLRPHLAIIADQAKALGLAIVVPDARGVRVMVRRGVRISPMHHFFTEVGFNERAAAIADAAYRNEFSSRYPLPPFPGVDAMLKRLAEANLPLGFVTSNTLENVGKGLGDLLEHFRPDCRFSADDPAGRAKSETLVAAAATLRLEPRQLIYVGDQPADHDAAKRAGTEFLGVSYGWGIDASDTDFPVATSPAEVADHLLGRLERNLFMGA